MSKKGNSILPQRKGKLVVRHGPMWSDKTTWLINQYNKPGKSIAFKPILDNRYTNNSVLRSHNGDEAIAIMIDSQKPSALWRSIKGKKINRVLIDETNFFPETLIKVVFRILNQGVDVYAAGLTLDSDRKDFGPTKKLMKFADEVIEGRARCDYRYSNGVCLNPAQYTFAKMKKEAQLVVGAADLYGAACADHYHLLHVSKKGNGNWMHRLRLPRSVQLNKQVKEYLKLLSLPYLRRPLKFSPDRWPRIEVGADTMRVGKTTAVQVLGSELKKAKLPIKISLEDWQHNPHLKKSYKDSSLALLNSQKWFIKRKFDQLNKTSNQSITIQDVHPEMDFCYALTNLIMGRLTLNHFKDYVDYFYQFDWARVPAADTLLYLTASDEVVIKRAQQNARPFEKIEKDYFLVMKRVNQAWLAGTKYLLDVVVMPINTDNFNFAANKGPKIKLTKNVLKKLAELGWRYS
jgi:thymidine kinase/deoxyadenosine/deoxycytidine kinase